MPRRIRSLFVMLATVALVVGLPALSPSPSAAIGTADLSVSIVGEASHLRFGDTMTLTITVSNLGPDAATGVILGLGTSDSLQNFGIACPDGSISSRCDLTTLAADALVTVHATVRAGSFSCCPDRRLGVARADVFQSPDADTTDLVPENNSASLDIKLTGKGPA